MKSIHEIPITSLYGVGKAKASAYASLGVETVGDLLYFFPRAYENRGFTVPLSAAREDIKNAIIMTVATEPRVSLIRRGMSLLKFRAFDESGSCEITYFNQNYLKDKFHVGSTFRFWGKVERQGKKISMTSPMAEAYTESVPLPPLASIYKLTEGLSQKVISTHIEAALTLARESLPDYLPERIREKYSLCTLHFALEQIHSPSDYQSLALAKRRLVFDEFFLFAAGIGRSSGETQRYKAPVCSDGDVTPLLNLLPYKLTGAQSRAIDDIRRDMAQNIPMGRIIIGDVGCGKTVCAAAAMYISVKNGHQAALMAPTEILANQHYADLSPIFERLGIKCALLTGSLTPAKKRRLHEQIASTGEDRIDIVIGTQALISEGVKFSDAGLVITDEQHRFGVGQRAALSERNNHTHVLVMSATPIPRSLALVMYGDLKLSKIDEMPAGRQRVDTFLVDEGYRARLDGFIKKNVAEGGQVYIVCPAVEEAEEEAEDEILFSDIGFDNYFSKEKKEKTPLKAATQYADELAARMPELNIAYVHGRMKVKDKDAVMERFVRGEIDVLVSTTVIEVGVNVPNASLMIVENAERFGLSQLHQLRGRVGRGKRKSYCVLVSGTPTLAGLGETATKRLRTMCNSYNGFEIAEEDLKLRGPGDFLSTSTSSAIRQSGDIGFKLADMCEDTSLMTDAFSEAGALISADRQLAAYPELSQEINRIFAIRSDVIN
ncbi:MAG: ATP-dependent DNA helicase RecG [Clostridia bacterium]|nr:ATP-dependent DNA helicase RecG [Clostridia bacterium]